jgi:hypothetical protein
MRKLCLHRRYWPNEEEQWAEGLITDYREWSDEHCIVYNINTPRESYEWFRIRSSALPLLFFSPPVSYT